MTTEPEALAVTGPYTHTGKQILAIIRLVVEGKLFPREAADQIALSCKPYWRCLNCGQAHNVPSADQLLTTRLKAVKELLDDRSDDWAAVEEAIFALAPAKPAADAERLVEQAELAIIRKADMWLAQQYGLRPLVADLDRIRALAEAGGSGRE